MGISFPIPVSMVEIGSTVSGVTNTIIAAGASFEFPLVYIPTWLYHKTDRALLQLNIPYVYNSAGADNWINGGTGVTISPDDNAHTYQALDFTNPCFRCQNGATSSLVQWMGTYDIGGYIDDAIDYGILMGFAPHMHVSLTASSNANSIAFMLHSAVLKIYLRG